MNTVKYINMVMVNVLMCISFSACGSSDDDNKLDSVIDNNEYELYLGKNCKDMTDLSLSDVTILDDSDVQAISIMGLKNARLYIGVFEKNAPYTALLEYTSTETLNKHLNVNMGYVDEIDFNTLKLQQIVKYGQNYYIIGATDIKTYYNSVVDKIFVFNNSIKTYEGAFIAGRFSEWYEGYMLLSTGNEFVVNPSYILNAVDPMIFSPQGTKEEKMTSEIISNLSYTGTKLISYDECIWAGSNPNSDVLDWHGCRFYRKKLDKFVWNTYYDVSFDDTVIDELSLLDSSTSIWKYQLKLTYTNGDIKTTTIYVNIDNGTISTQ